MAPFLTCKECDKEFSGPEPFTQHCMSKAHIQRVSSKPQDPSVAYQADTPGSKNQQFRCAVCDIGTSGPKPLQQHLIGSKHKAELDKQIILQGNQPEPARVPSPGGEVLQCVTCGKCFSGPVSHKQHFDSKKHKRKVEMVSMRDRLSFTEPATCPSVQDIVSDNVVPSPNSHAKNIVISPMSSEHFQVPTENAQSLYPVLPNSEIPPRALACEEKKKKPTGCASAIRALFRKKSKK